MEIARIQFMTWRNWVNIVLLGFGFMFLFTAFQTSAFVQTITLNSFLAPHCQNNSNASTYVDGGITISEEFSTKLGYYSLCLIYLMVALGNWLSVPIVAVFGSRFSLIITGFLYVVYIAALVRPYVPVIFLGAFLLGSAGGSRTGVFSRAHVGLAGLFIGLGEIVGGGLFGIFGRYTNRWGKDPVVLLGMLAHFTVYLLVYYNLPSHASIEDVPSNEAYGALINPSNIYVVMVCAFLLGIGDACYNTQIYSLIGVLYASDEDSAPAMALYKFFQSLAAMVGFLTSSLILLQWQLIALVVLATVGTLTFAVVEWKHYKGPTQKSD